jgi:dihydroorotase
MSTLLIKQAQIVNEGTITVSDILIRNQRIEKIQSSIQHPNAIEIPADGLVLLPGMIDDQVHFREPGLTHKATIHSESRAAAAGGITSFMDMPNTLPNTLNCELLEEKYTIASKDSLINYSFFMGINQENLDEALRVDPEWVCGITDDGLYFNSDKGILANYPDYLEKVFARCETLIALHCEDDEIIHRNFSRYQQEYGDAIPMDRHPLIRSEEACVAATKRVLEIARKHGNRLHIYHVSTAAEALLFQNDLPPREKRITSEACVHHLWFADQDYERLGAKLKWNPAVKSAADRAGLQQALKEGRIDIIATDHAPHTLTEKDGTYKQAMSGGPLVQHALPAALELYRQGVFSLEDIVLYTTHKVADIYRIKDRGYIREGYYADLVLVDLNASWMVTPDNILSKCGWSPFEGTRFNSTIECTMVNGQIVYEAGRMREGSTGMRLQFDAVR